MIATRNNPTPATPKLLLTIREAATALGISERGMVRLLQPHGPIPIVRAGMPGEKLNSRAVRVSVAALEKWIAEQESRPPDAPHNAAIISEAAETIQRTN